MSVAEGEEAAILHILLLCIDGSFNFNIFRSVVFYSVVDRKHKTTLKFFLSVLIP